MTRCTYLPRVAVHPERRGGARSLPPLWVVIHTTEGPEGPGAARQLAEFTTRPGDRPSTSGGASYGSSYHAVADIGLQVIPLVEDRLVAFSAPGSNTEGLHIVIPGRAGQTRDEWLSGSTREAIRTVAAFLLDTRDRYGIPTERVSAAELRSRTRGYCDHATVSAAFGRTNHTDVGPMFPWDVLRQDLIDLDYHPEKDNDMIRYQALPPEGLPGNPPWFVVIEGAARYSTNGDGSEGLPTYRLPLEQYDHLHRSVMGYDRA